MTPQQQFTIASIVEGESEEQAVPVLLRRLIDSAAFRIAKPIRVRAKRFLQDEAEFKRYLNFARREASGFGAIMILLDLDDGCAATEAARIKDRAQQVVYDCPVCVVLATREFETWFLHAADSLAGKRNLRNGIVAPQDPESIRGAKEWLSRNMADPRRQSYSPTIDQPAFAQIMDLGLVRKSRSFRKLESDLRSLERFQID